MDEILSEYISINEDSTQIKLQSLEKFRKAEFKLKDYTESLLELDKSQIDVNLYKFQYQRDKIISILKDFNANNIDRELFKLEEVKIYIKKFKNDLLSVSSKIDKVEQKWEFFVKRYDFIKGSIIEKIYNDSCREIKILVEKSSVDKLSSIDFEVSKFESKIINLISSLESLQLYLSNYIFLGNEAMTIKSEIKNIFKLDSLSEENFLKKIEGIFENIKNIEDESIYSTAGLKVFKAVIPNQSSISMFTIKINGEYLKYDTFFNNEEIEYIDTGDIYYIDNFPKEGIFKGRDVCEKINVSSEYINVVLKIKRELNLILQLSGFSLLFLSLLSILIESTIFSIILILFFVMFVIASDNIFNLIKNKFSKKLKHVFYFDYIDLIFLKFGNIFDYKKIIEGLVLSFDRNIAVDKGDKIWIKE